MNNFHLTFKHFELLLLSRMQFIDRETILLKYTAANKIMREESTSGSNYTAFFVVYSLRSTQVLGVYENSSTEFLQLYLKFDFRTSGLNSPSRNKYSRLLIDQTLYSVSKARNGGYSHAVKRVLSSLPANHQSMTTSHLVDQNIFSYDEKYINMLDRLKVCSDAPIKFYCRKTGRVKFRINPNSATPSTHTNRKFYHSDLGSFRRIFSTLPCHFV